MYIKYVDMGTQTGPTPNYFIYREKVYHLGIMFKLQIYKNEIKTITIYL